MASHSCAVTVEVAPADSAVSVVGTGVELGARADAIFAIESLGVVGRWASVSLLRYVSASSRRECTKVATSSGAASEK